MSARDGSWRLRGHVVSRLGRQTGVGCARDCGVGQGEITRGLADHHLHAERVGHLVIASFHLLEHGIPARASQLVAAQTCLGELGHHARTGAIGALQVELHGAK